MPRYRHDPSKHLVGFLVGEVMYAVRIEMVREISNPLPVVSLPHAPRAVRGVADYRGVVVPVIDLRERFGLPQAPLSRKTKWVVLDVSKAPRSEQGGPPTLAAGNGAALVVDAVTEVFGYDQAGIRPAPPLGDGDDLRGIEGVTTASGRMVFVLDASAFGPLTEAVLGSEGAPVQTGTM